MNSSKMKHYNKHKELGLCVDCSQKAVAGRVRCKKHLNKMKRYQNERKN